MLRRTLLYLSAASWARNITSNWGLARRVARRFVAGETLDEAINVSKELNQKGIEVTLDYLGESVEKEEDTRDVLATYQELLRRIHDEALQASVSLKLTHLGYDIREELAVLNLRMILNHAQRYDIGVTIDMESSDYTDDTFRIYRTMRDEYGFDNVGTVVQAYLRRTAEDMQQLAQEGAHIRLCKGAYLEPPDIAFPKKADVDQNFVKVTQDFLRTDSDAFLAVASHDENMIQATLDFVEQHNIPRERYEFQMLYGIRSQRHNELAQAGHKMRVYVPFGAAWYPYFMRRLAERPANLWFFLRSMFR